MAYGAPGTADAVVAACEALNRAVDGALNAGWKVTLGQETAYRQVAGGLGGFPESSQTLHVTVELSRKVGP